MAFFAIFYFIGGVLLTVAGVGNILSANFMRKRKHRMFSFVIGCLNCLQIPFGTATGQAVVSLINSFSTVARDAVQINPVAPSLFAADTSGQVRASRPTLPRGRH